MNPIIMKIGPKNFIHNTLSLCNTCFRHIPGEVYEQNGLILLDKECPEHGLMTGIVEIDPEFYYSLEYTKKVHSEVIIEVTDRCNLKCPHCYHIPDNKTVDRPIEDILDQLKRIKTKFTPALAGAEPTLRKDFVELVKRINEDIDDKKYFITLTNGIKFENFKFAADVSDAGMEHICVGLNHWTYQGKKVHQKQLIGINNVIETDMKVGYVGYTLEDINHLPDVLAEISQIDHPKINHYRIRCGSFIGRSSDKYRSFLSTTVKKIKELLGDSVYVYPKDNNPYHVNIKWNNKEIRLIQWPDVTNIDMEELTSGPYAQFYDGPATNFVHQVITRDAFKNMGLPKLDECPPKYHFNPWEYTYWKPYASSRVIDYD